MKSSLIHLSQPKTSEKHLGFISLKIYSCRDNTNSPTRTSWLHSKPYASTRSMYSQKLNWNFLKQLSLLKQRLKKNTQQKSVWKKALRSQRSNSILLNSATSTEKIKRLTSIKKTITCMIRTSAFSAVSINVNTQKHLRAMFVIWIKRLKNKQ